MANGWYTHHFDNDLGEYLKRSNPNRSVGDKSSLIVANPLKLDLHLSPSEGLERGPIIQRTGEGPPIMEDPQRPGSYTADPEWQRIGTN